MAKRDLEILIKNGKLHLPIIGDSEWELDDTDTYSPLELTVISVAACGARVFQSMARKSNLEVDLKNVYIQYTRHEEDRVRPIKSISLTYSIDAQTDKEKRLSQTIVNRVAQYCPVMLSLNPDISIEEKIEFV